MIDVVDCKTHTFEDQFLSTDGKFLNLSHPDAVGTDELEWYIDEVALSHPIYDTVDTLFIDTDYCNSMPVNVSKFKNLKSLTVHGTRFWDIDLQHVPATVTHLDISGNANLKSKCINGMEKLVELERVLLTTMAFYIQDFFYDYKVDDEDLSEVIPLPLLCKLSIIELHTLCFLLEPTRDPKWAENLLKHPLLQNIKHVIKSITLELTNEGLEYVLIKLGQ